MVRVISCNQLNCASLWNANKPAAVFISTPSSRQWLHWQGAAGYLCRFVGDGLGFGVDDGYLLGGDLALDRVGDVGDGDSLGLHQGRLQGGTQRGHGHCHSGSHTRNSNTKREPPYSDLLNWGGTELQQSTATADIWIWNNWYLRMEKVSPLYRLYSLLTLKISNIWRYHSYTADMSCSINCE